MVAAHAPGAGPAAAANLVELADAAFARVTGLVAELTKVFALAPDLREGHFAHIAAIQLQIPAGLHLAGMADEAETRAAQTAPGHGVHAEGFRRDAQAFLMRALAHDPVIVRRAGGLEVHVCALAEIIQPVQHVLVFLCGDDLIRQARGPAHGHQQKDMPGRRADALAELEDLLEAAQVVAGHRGVDLKGHAHVLEIADAAHAVLKRAGHAAKGVVTGRVGPVDGNGAALHARLFDPAGAFRGDQGAVGRKGAGQALGVGIGHQFVDVRPHHRIAAGEDDDGIAHLRKRVDERLGLVRGQLAGIRLWVGLGPAVLAGQVAGAGHFPGDQTADRAAVFQNAGGHARRIAGLTPRMAAGMAFRHGSRMPAVLLVSVHQRASLCLRISSAK